MNRELTITATALRDLLEQNRPATALDVRPDAERSEWFIPGSIHVDVYKALWRRDAHALKGAEIPGDRPVVTVCAAGKTSLIAADLLRRGGFEALSLERGMKAWSFAWNTAEVSWPNSNTRVIQVRRTGKGCLSYILGSKGEAAVIDASLDHEVYVELAARYGWKITHVLDTHIHADHLSRSRALAEDAGAVLYLPAQERVSYDFTPLQDGTVLSVGEAKLKVLHTPGHTLESVCYLLDDQALFTGDTLFLSSIGRPDLEASTGEAQLRASALYHSLHKLMALPATTLVLPGHTSKPVPFDNVPVGAMLIDVRKRIDVLGLDETTFIQTVLSRIPPTPPNHHRIVGLNEAGVLPPGDPTDLEAGANRCAIS